MLLCKKSIGNYSEQRAETTSLREQRLQIERLHRIVSVLSVKQSLFSALLNEYIVQYTQPEARKLSIFFDTTFPYQIKGWQEKGRLTTTATLKKSIRLDYWSKHNNVHRELQIFRSTIDELRLVIFHVGNKRQVEKQKRRTSPGGPQLKTYKQFS